MPLTRQRYVVKLSFDGSMFEGYARQREGHTVEGEVLEAMRSTRIASDARSARFGSAARVDRGVSAVSAAVAFDTDARPSRLLPSLNSATGLLTFHSICNVPLGYDARRMAEGRFYRYHFPPSTLEGGLDVPAMREAAGAFVGERDFSAFARLDGRDPVRTVTSMDVERRAGFLVLDVRGRSFLWNQVRRMASALELVGQGQLDRAGIEGALAGREGLALRPVPPEGLVLMDVAFPGLEFRPAGELPRGKLRRLREQEHRARVEVARLDYLGELVGL